MGIKHWGWMDSLWLFGHVAGILLRKRFLGFFKKFHEQDCLVKSLNATFLVLVPKKGVNI